MRDFLPMPLQEGDVAVYWPSPAACAMRLTADACGVARLHSNDPARRGCGCVLAITRGWRHAAHSPAADVLLHRHKPVEHRLLGLLQAGLRTFAKRLVPEKIELDLRLCSRRPHGDRIAARNAIDIS